MKLFGYILATVLLVTPMVSQAGLVPVACENPEQCGTCEFVSTVNNVVQFIVAELLPLIAVAMFVWAGFLLVTSRGDAAQIQTAKKIFTNVALGIVLALAAYLIINTVMQGLVGGSSELASWDQIECMYPAGALDITFEFYVPPDANLIQGGAGALSGDGYAGLPGMSGTALCNPTYLGSHFPGEENIAACVLAGESSCGALFYSTTDFNHDTSGNRVPFSVSPWQINLTVWDITAADVSNGCSRAVNCTDAYSGTNYSGTLVNRSIFDECVAVLSDSNCSGAVAERIEATQGWTAWSAYTRGNCGR